MARREGQRPGALPLSFATPLRGSLRPVDFASALRAIPQVHFVGTRDTRVPRSAVDAYVAALGAPPGVRVESVADFDHHCCWETAWPELLALVLGALGIWWTRHKNKQKPLWAILAGLSWVLVLVSLTRIIKGGYLGKYL